VGGIATACLLGAGVGLWARPGAGERPGAARPQPAAAPAAGPARRLAIVVDDTPPPIGEPLAVLTPAQAPPAAIPPPPKPAAAKPAAPSRPPNGLVRVVAPVPAPLAPPRRPATPSAPAAPPVPKAAAGEAAARPKPPTRPTELAAPKLRKAALKSRTERRRPERREVAEAKPKPRHGLAALTHAFAKLAPHPATPASARAEAAPPRRKPAAETRLAKVEPRRAKPPTPPPSAAAAPIKVANVQTRCASPDPGEALACGDPGLSAAQRRLERAYRDAEAAGVPAATLERQQQRWRAARAAAAREAPWAVRQVYQARIAELQDLARDARGE
jgi:hypothetical protein